jgi:hypothetical protein
MKSIDIFIKSYRKDFWLLHLCLKSIMRNVTGYNNIILLIPIDDKEYFDTRELPDRTLVHYVPDKPGGRQGWLYQQWYKLSAYNYCYAPYIMFADSDCIFTYPIDLQQFIADGKPEILYTDWKDVGDAICWRKPTEDFMKDTVPYEFMRRNCCIYHRDTLTAIAKYAPDLEQTIMASHDFSEFNCMGAFAYKNEREKYNFVNTAGWQLVPAKAEQVWSHAHKNPGASENHLREYIRTLETICKAFGVPLPE